MTLGFKVCCPKHPRRMFLWSMRNCALLLTACLTAAAGNPSDAAPVLMISIDGMKPEYVLQADAHGLKLPYLRSLMSDGTYAQGVVGVWPTVTYPSHTTLITGVSPAQHGILANLQFDPQRRFQDAWFWYAAQIRVPTLWQAAHAKGLTTASIGWPVTVGAAGIDYLIPEYWRITGSTEQLDPAERSLIAALTLPNGLLQELQNSAGPYMQGNDTTRNGDDIKTRFAVELMHRHKVSFMTVHLSSLDDAEHDHGVFSKQANHNMEAIDSMVAELAAAARANDANTVVAVVSDHGFTPMHHEVDLYVPFIHAGLITTRENPETHALEVASWRAQPWLADGMAAIVLHDSRDQNARASVEKLLNTLAADPKNGIDAVKNREQIKLTGGFPDAEFLVAFKPGFDAGEHMTGDMLNEVSGSHGDHGFSPDFPEMRASFFVSGAGIARHRDLGVIQMQQIAPTIAGLLGATLSNARSKPLQLQP